MNSLFLRNIYLRCPNEVNNLSGPFRKRSDQIHEFSCKPTFLKKILFNIETNRTNICTVGFFMNHKKSQQYKQVNLLKWTQSI
jgi:hypothetical protein